MYAKAKILLYLILNFIIKNFDIEDAYSTASNRRLNSFMDRRSNQYTAITHSQSSSVVMVFNLRNGNLIEARQLQYPTNLSSTYIISANGQVSNDKIVVSLASESLGVLSIVDTTDWSHISYQTSGFHVPVSISELFDTDQIIINFATNVTARSDLAYSLQAAYDMLNYTEIYTK